MGRRLATFITRRFTKLLPLQAFKYFLFIIILLNIGCSDPTEIMERLRQ
jgi:hypothetical protein